MTEKERKKINKLMEEIEKTITAIEKLQYKYDVLEHRVMETLKTKKEETNDYSRI